MFILLKILLFFFRPLLWIIVLFVWALLTKPAKRKKVLFITGFCFLLFFTNPFIIRQCITWYEVKPVHLSPSAKYNAGILLGGMVGYNRYDRQGYFNGAADRFIETALLYKTGHIDHIIIAAGNGYITKNNFREALFIKERLTELGVPGETIYTDTSSRNTLENARYSKNFIDSFRIQGPYLLISSAMHLPRAELVFKKAGIIADLYPCDFISKSISNDVFGDYILPSSLALTYWDNFIKEILGILTYKMTGKG